jgi:MSHA biogenesis protein MshP
MFRKAGFSIVAALFLLVVLSLLGALILSVTGMQQASGQLDILGVRAYDSARVGAQWGAYQVLDPNNAEPACGIPSCPAPSQNLPALAGSLSGFTVTVTCTVTANTTEGNSNRNVRVFEIVATACNQPSAGSCPNAAPADGYVERQVQAVLSKCKDATAAPPRCSCGA